MFVDFKVVVFFQNNLEPEDQRREQTNVVNTIVPLSYIL